MESYEECEQLHSGGLHHSSSSSHNIPPQHPAKIWPRVIAELLPAIYSPVISPLWKLKRCNWKLGVDLLPSYHPFTRGFPSSSFWMWCASRDLELVLWQCCLRWKYAIIIIACETGTKSRTANAQNSDGLQFKVWIVRNYILLAGSRVAAGTAAHSDSWRNFTNIELGKGGQIANTHPAKRINKNNPSMQSETLLASHSTSQDDAEFCFNILACTFAVYIFKNFNGVVTEIINNII